VGGSDKLQGVASREETENSHPRDVPWPSRLSARRPGDISEPSARSPLASSPIGEEARGHLGGHARRPGDSSLVLGQWG
jgi:hypothetical protein